MDGRIKHYIERADSLYYYSTDNPTKAYDLYRQAYLASDSIGQNKYAFKALNNILSLLILNNNHPELWDFYSEEMGRFVSSAQDSLWYEFQQNKIILQRYYSNYDFQGFNIHNWDLLIAKAQAINDIELEIEIRAIYAIYLELTNQDIERAKNQYFQILDIVESDMNLLSKFRFTTLGNLGNLFQQEAEYQLAIDYYYKALAEVSTTKTPQNEVRLYNWISECYTALGIKDSAFVYLNSAYKSEVELNRTKYDVAISKIEEEYQNQQLTSELTFIEDRNKRNLEIFGLIISLGILLGIYQMTRLRLSRVKTKALANQLKLEETSKEVVAINSRLDGEEQERQRISALLHDSVCSQLTAASFHLKHLSNINTDSQNGFQKVNTIVSEASQQARDLSHDLYPPVLIHYGLGKAITELALKYQSALIDFKVYLNPEPPRISPKMEGAIYFCIQEILQNVLKHSEADRCIIRFSLQSESMVIEISDNGVGYSIDGVIQEGLGLISIRARLENLGGSFIIKHQEQTLHVLKVPCRASDN